MKSFLQKFAAQDDASASASMASTSMDWIVLTAGILLLSSGVMFSIGTGSGELASNTSDLTETAPVERAL
jgi:hypothetical protein